MLQLIIYGILAAGLCFGGLKIWSGFTGQYIAEGKQVQLAEDQKIIDATKVQLEGEKRRAEKAEADAAEAASAAQAQNVAIEAATAAAATAQAAARSAGIKYAQEVAKSAERITRLQSAAGAVPRGGQSCEALLKATDDILRESARVRSGVPQ